MNVEVSQNGALASKTKPDPLSQPQMQHHPVLVTLENETTTKKLSQTVNNILKHINSQEQAATRIVDYIPPCTHEQRQVFY